MTAETPVIPPELLDYFAARQQQRDDRANTAWRTLTNFERRVLKEAAVMGYVLGRRAGESWVRSGKSFLDEDPNWPHDFQIVQQVLQHCDSTSDLYPFLGEACDGRRRRITAARRWPGEETTR